MSTGAGSGADSGLSPQGCLLTQLLCLFLASLQTRGISWGSEAVAVQQESALLGFGESHALAVLGQEPRSSVRAPGLLLGVFCAPAGEHVLLSPG